MIFSLSKGIGTILVRDDEREGDEVWDMLSVCLSVPLVTKTILLSLSHVNSSLENRGMTGTCIFFPTECHCPADKQLRVLSKEYQKAVLNCVNWRTDGCCFVDKTETRSMFLQRHRDLIATKNSEKLCVFDKGAFVQLILNPAECVGQLSTRMKPIEIYEWVFCFWGRVKNLRKKGTSQVDNQ